MTPSPEALFSPKAVFEEMKKNGVTHVLYLPSSETKWLYPLMKAEPTLHIIAVSREALAFSGAAGLAVGGKTPVVLIQNSGLLESGDSLRGWGRELNIPMVILVGYKGWAHHAVTRDSVALHTEPFLRAFETSFYLIETNADIPRISAAFEETRKTKKPVAVLISDKYRDIDF